VLDVDTIVMCAGQEPRRELLAELQQAGVAVSLIGGADVAAELDAKRAISGAPKALAACRRGVSRSATRPLPAAWATSSARSR
jgi:fructose-1,6-bisphosphatase/sedoheptulose 1,7-bisphosphatase-like protein